jgi:hypothetical protein
MRTPTPRKATVDRLLKEAIEAPFCRQPTRINQWFVEYNPKAHLEARQGRFVRFDENNKWSSPQ